MGKRKGLSEVMNVQEESYKEEHRLGFQWLSCWRRIGTQNRGTAEEAEGSGRCAVLSSSSSVV